MVPRDFGEIAEWNILSYLMSISPYRELGAYEISTSSLCTDTAHCDLDWVGQNIPTVLIGRFMRTQVVCTRLKVFKQPPPLSPSRWCSCSSEGGSCVPMSSVWVTMTVTFSTLCPQVSFAFETYLQGGKPTIAVIPQWHMCSWCNQAMLEKYLWPLCLLSFN